MCSSPNNPNPGLPVSEIPLSDLRSFGELFIPCSRTELQEGMLW